MAQAWPRTDMVCPGVVEGGGGVLYLQDQPLGDLGICVGVVLVRMLVHHPMR